MTRYNQSLLIQLIQFCPIAVENCKTLKSARTAWVVVAPSLFNAADATHTQITALQEISPVRIKSRERK